MKGLLRFLAQVLTGYSDYSAGKSSQQWVGTIGCHLAVFSLVSTPIISVVCRLHGEEVLCGRLLSQMGAGGCSGVRMTLDSPVVGSG